MKILTISNIYPTSKNPELGTFIADQVNSLNSFAETTVVFKSNKSRLSYLSFAVKTLCAIQSTDYDLIHAHYGFHSMLVPMLFRCKPLIVTFHGSDALIEPGRNRLYAFLQCSTVSCASRIVAVNEHIRSHLVTNLKADPEKISVIPCGVDPKKFYPRPKENMRARLGINKNARVALFVGRLTQAKGVDLIREAAYNLKKVDFYFIGNGPLKWDLPNCFFVGAAEHSVIPEWINAADVLLLPSLSEGTPVSILESLACRTPVICSTVGACPELISDGVTGLLIAPGNANALVSAIRKALFGMNFDTEMGRKLVAQNYSLNKISNKLNELYTSVLSEYKRNDDKGKTGSVPTLIE